MDLASSGFKHTESRIFCGFRALGYVSNHIPCLVRYIFKRKKNFIVGCTGHTFNTFESQQMKMLTVSDVHETEITCMAGDTYHVYTAANKRIYAWRRGTELKHTYEGHEHDIICILSLGEYLISIDDGGTIAMYNIVDEERRWAVEFSADFMPTCIIHPITYVNQVLIGSAQGRFDLFDFNRVCSVHRFEGWNSAILKMAQSPTVDVVAFCLANKSIILHNLKEDKTLMELTNLETPISLAFRSDRDDTLIVGGDKGSLTVWDTTSGEMNSFKKDAHRSSVTGIQCFVQEPIFVTSSPDNSIQVWIFDLPDGGFRLYSNRSGHHRPSNRIRFYGTPANSIASAGTDATFRTFHVYNETYSRCFSKAKIPLWQLKMTPNSADEEFMPEIIDFTDESVTTPDHHGSLAALHAGQVNVTTWSLSKMKRENNILTPTSDNSAQFATCLCISSCGQFVIVGYDNGFVQRFNIQSGIHRKSYGKPSAHEMAVQGVAVNQVNTIVATGGIDKKMKFWKFDTGELIKTHDFSSSVFTVFSHRVSGLIGVILDNCSMVVMDINSTKVFRKFTELSCPILCGCFTPDNRWVTVSTSDGLIRTWDLSTSSLIDNFRLQSIATSIDYSPNGEFLAMSLHDSVGIYLWVNKTLYNFVSLMPLPEDYEPPCDPDSEEAMELDEQGEVINQEYQSIKQIDKSLATLSLLPGTKWKNLLNLDIIRMRNRPKQPPKTYVAPFFLSTLIAAGSGVGAETEGDDTTPSTSSKIIQTNINLTKFGKLLQTVGTTNCCEELCQMLASMNPIEIETEIVALSPLGGGSIKVMKSFLTFICKLIRSNLVFEGAEAYLALFLKIHGDDIRKEDTLRKQLHKVQQHLDRRNETIRQEVTSILACTYYLKSTLLN